MGHRGCTKHIWTGAPASLWHTDAAWWSAFVDYAQQVQRAPEERRRPSCLPVSCLYKTMSTCKPASKLAFKLELRTYIRNLMHNWPEMWRQISSACGPKLEKSVPEKSELMAPIFQSAPSGHKERCWAMVLLACEGSLPHFVATLTQPRVGVSVAK